MDQTEWTRVLVFATALLGVIAAALKLWYARHEGKKHPETSASRQTSQRLVEDTALDEARGQAPSGTTEALGMAASAMEQVAGLREDLRRTNVRFDKVWAAYRALHSWGEDIHERWDEHRERDSPPPRPYSLPHPDNL